MFPLNSERVHPLSDTKLKLCFMTDYTTMCRDSFSWGSHFFFFFTDSLIFLTFALRSLPTPPLCLYTHRNKTPGYRIVGGTVAVVDGLWTCRTCFRDTYPSRSATRSGCVYSSPREINCLIVFGKIMTLSRQISLNLFCCEAVAAWL